MSQQSKLRQSRQQWKHKAKERADHNRYLRKELERLRHERDRAKQALKEANEQRRQKEARPTHLKAHRVWVTLTLFARAHLSFRAVSRVLHVLADWLGIGKAPCPQTVINWVRRLSMVRMQSVKLLQGAARHLIPFTNGLIWMIDTSITLGTGKLLSVLALDAHHYQLAGCAPGFQPVRCIAVAVSPSWTGERLAALLERVIAVVGLSADWHRPSNFVGKYLQQHGYRIVPVNPRYDSILGERCYHSLDEIGFAVDLVDVFRRAEDVAGVVDEFLATDAPAIWLQYDCVDEPAALRARQQGRVVVMDRCLMVDHNRLLR